MRIQHSILAISACAVLTLTGCASSMGIGETGLTCPAGEGMPCTDSRTVFQRTNSFQPGDSMYAERARGETGSHVNAAPQPFDNFEVDVRGGAISQPLPVRTGAKVMRIWVNSWIDERGDLNYPSLLFTEITPRQWNVGNSASQTMSPRRITPLRVKEGAVTTKTTTIKPLSDKPRTAVSTAPTAAAATPPAKTPPLLPAPPTN